MSSLYRNSSLLTQVSRFGHKLFIFDTHYLHLTQIIHKYITQILLKAVLQSLSAAFLTSTGRRPSADAEHRRASACFRSVDVRNAANNDCETVCNGECKTVYHSVSCKYILTDWLTDWLTDLLTDLCSLTNEHGKALWSLSPPSVGVSQSVSQWVSVSL